MKIMTLYHFEIMEKFDVKEQEAIDFRLLQEFNEETFKLKHLGRRDGEANPIDASGLTEDDRVINIEIKSRDFSINKYPTLMLETHKAYSLQDEYIKQGNIPLYVNFLNDDSVVVFNLLKSSGYMERRKTHSRLYGNKEFQYKLFLPIKNGWIYKKDENNNYKLMQKGW